MPCPARSCPTTKRSERPQDSSTDLGVRIVEHLDKRVGRRPNVGDDNRSEIRDHPQRLRSCAPDSGRLIFHRSQQSQNRVTDLINAAELFGSYSAQRTNCLGRSDADLNLFIPQRGDHGRNRKPRVSIAEEEELMNRLHPSRGGTGSEPARRRDRWVLGLPQVATRPEQKPTARDQRDQGPHTGLEPRHFPASGRRRGFLTPRFRSAVRPHFR
jgi:hypothetical protein